MKNNVKRERGGNPEKKERSVADLFAIFKRNHRARGHTSESRGAEPTRCAAFTDKSDPGVNISLGA